MPFNSTYYPIPQPEDTRDLLAVFQFISNDLTGGLFFPIMILVVWTVQFIGVLAEGRPASRGWVFASFVSTILSMMLGILALLEQRWVYLLVIMTSFGLFWLKLAKSKSQ